MAQERLTFEEFCKKDKGGIPRYAGSYIVGNHFYGWFVSNDNPVCTMTRQADPIVRFQQAHPELEERVTREVTEAIDRRLETGKSVLDELKPLEPLLYEAYQKMRTLVENDRELGL